LEVGQSGQSPFSLRSLTQPLAAMVASGAIEPGDIVRAEVEADILILTVEV
jgi:hypothetical protein